MNIKVVKFVLGRPTVLVFIVCVNVPSVHTIVRDVSAADVRNI